MTVAQLDASGLGGALLSNASGLGGALLSNASGLGGALRAPLGPVAAPLVPRCALLPAPTPRRTSCRAMRNERVLGPTLRPRGVSGSICASRPRRFARAVG